MAANNRTEKQNVNRDLEPVMVALCALLKEVSVGKRIDSGTREKLIKSLANSSYSQPSIASMVGVSLTDVNRVLKKKK